ncbi:AEC family transporter [Mangrovicoccus algicola]|uniref:AEC family transporter n=1 Tax=Mangrovicoccus algicola TaxID=2771008 RepID=A0A8J7CTR8_9RHOB|nr:AEC family transporter [Mangrovicoccus algicola]MBE3636944.1 AEC family transporter [Mangrovicoccus algicola]
MLDVFLLAVPLYLLISAGFAVVRSGYLPPENLGGVGQFALKVCLPVLIFAAVSKPGALMALNWRFVAGYSAGSLLLIAAMALAMMRAFGHPPGRAVILGLGCGSSNSAFFGLPVAAIALGPDRAATIFAWILLAENMIVIPLCVSLAESIETRSASFLHALRAVLAGMARSPLMIALVAGLAVSVTGIEPPEPLARSMSMIVTAAPVMSLMLVGGFIAHEDIRGAGLPSAVITLAKLVAHPLAVWLVLSALPGLDHATVIGGVLYAGVPMFTIFTLFAARHGGETLASAAQVLATVLSLLTINGLLFLTIPGL